MANSPEDNRPRIEAKVSRGPKPPGYIEIGGMEQEIPGVMWISRFLNAGKKPFTIVGGGSSGKTESLVTALHQTGKSYELFDLQKWIVSHFTQNELVDTCLRDPELGQEARAYLFNLRTHFAHIDDLDMSQSEKAKRKRQRVYDDSYHDTTLGIKHAEAYLLEKVISGEITEDPNDGNTLQRLRSSEADVLILDSIDLGIGRTLGPVEQETAIKLVDFAISLPDKQIGIVLHPPAREDTAFMKQIRSQLLKQRTFFEAYMEYFPRGVQEAILRLVGIDGSHADDVIRDVMGLPGAYLDICTNEQIRRELLLLSSDDRLSKLRAMAEFSVEDNIGVNFDKASDAVQQVLMAIVRDEEFDTRLIEPYKNGRVFKKFPPDPRHSDVKYTPTEEEQQASRRHSLMQNLIRTGYVYIDGQKQELVMPPVVKRVLARLLA